MSENARKHQNLQYMRKMAKKTANLNQKAQKIFEKEEGTYIFQDEDLPWPKDCKFEETVLVD